RNSSGKPSANGRNSCVPSSAVSWSNSVRSKRGVSPSSFVKTRNGSDDRRKTSVATLNYSVAKRKTDGALIKSGKLTSKDGGLSNSGRICNAEKRKMGVVSIGSARLRSKDAAPISSASRTKRNGVSGRDSATSSDVETRSATGGE